MVTETLEREEKKEEIYMDEGRVIKIKGKDILKPQRDVHFGVGKESEREERK